MRRRVLNLLGAIVLVLLVLLRRKFDAVLGAPAGERRHARGLRIVIWPAALVLGAFIVVGIWALVDAGYWVVAAVVITHVALLFHSARRSQGRPDRPR